MMTRIKRWQQDIFVVFLFILLTGVAGRQVLSNLDSVIVGNDNDVYINPWADWWTLRVMRDPDLTLWQTDYLFYPQEVDLSFHSFSHLNTLISLALRPLAGVLPAYNLAILFNYVLTGLSMFHLARYLTRSMIAAILAGIVFAFNPHNLYQSAHPVLVSVWCFPWLTLSFLRAARQNSVKWAVIASVFVFLGAATSILLLVLMGMWLLFLVIYLFVSSQWPRPRWRILLIFGSFSLLLVFPLVWPLLREAITNNNGSFAIDPYASIVTDIFSIFIPPWYFWLKRGLYFGIVPVYLLLLAWQYQRREARLWLLLLIGAYLFSIGPRPEFLGYKLNITLPWSLWVAPILRNLYRVNILTSLALAMLVAYGWLAFAAQVKRRSVRRLAALAAMLAIFMDYTAVPIQYTPVRISTFYTEYLADVPDDVALATLPTGRQEDKRYLFYQTLHGHKITGGVISRPSDQVFDFIYNNDLLRAGAVDLEPTSIPKDVLPHLQALADAHVGYLILDKTLMDVDEWRAALPLSPVFEDELVLVYSTAFSR